MNFSWNMLRSQSGHINIDPTPYAKYQNISSSGSQDIVLTRFSIVIMARAITLVKSSQ